MSTEPIGGLRRWLAASALALELVAASAATGHAQALFTQSRLSQPAGIAVDVIGGVYVDSDIVSATAVTRFAPNGIATRQSPSLGPASAGFLGQLDVDPVTGNIYLLTRVGRIFALRPDTLQGAEVVDLGALAFQTFPEVLDVSTGTRRFVTFGTPVWGDIALRRVDSARLDVFVTGTASADGFPFVMRVRVDFQSGGIAAQIMAYSAVTFGAGFSQPRGVAVSPQGLLLTSLPVRPPGAVLFQDAGVVMSAGFPQDSALPPTVVPGLFGLTSRGMTSDAAGNFYVASGLASNACGAAGSGALIFISRIFSRIVCFNTGPTASGFTRSNDIAIDPRDGTVLVTFGEGAVVRFPVFPRPQTLEEFVESFYMDVLGRPAEAEGAAAWLFYLATACNADGFGTIALGFFGSTEFLQARPLSLPELVATLYRTFLHREPDPGGLAGWSAVLRTQRLAVARGFILSPEFQRLLPDRTDRAAVAAVITRLYQQILQREPDPAGLAGWVDHVVTTGDLEGAAAGFLASPEFEARPLSQSGYVTILYRTFLGREPDPAGLAGWTNALGSHLLGVVNAGFVRSFEFQSLVPEVCSG